MPLNPPAGNQHIIPCLHYEDAHAAIVFLCKAFGFERGLVLEGEDGDIDHAELRMYGETLMLAGAYADADLSTPNKLGGFHAHVTIYVADVDAHYERAIAAGAEVVQERTLMPYGDRRYVARDPEGYRWSFHEHVADPVPRD